MAGTIAEPFVTPSNSERLPRIENVGVGTTTDREKDTELPFHEAVSGTVRPVLPEATAAKPAVVEPASTVTRCGIDNTSLAPDSATAAPPVGAGCERRTVHVAELPTDTV